MNILHIWKSRLDYLFYVRYRILIIVIIAIGFIVSAGLLYVFLFVSAPADFSGEPVHYPTIKKDALERITRWNEEREEQRGVTFTVRNSAFSAPGTLR